MLNILVNPEWVDRLRGTENDQRKKPQQTKLFSSIKNCFLIRRSNVPRQRWTPCAATRWIHNKSHCIIRFPRESPRRSSRRSTRTEIKVPTWAKTKIKEKRKLQLINQRAHSWLVRLLCTTSQWQPAFALLPRTHSTRSPNSKSNLQHSECDKTKTWPKTHGE